MSNPRTVVITGSTSGIGLGIAHAFAATGCNIVVNSFSYSREDHAVAAEIAKAHGVRAVYLQADMSDGEACRQLIAKAAGEFGTVDVLVNNAGIQHVAPVEDFPVAKWDAIMAINLSSVFHTTAAMMPLIHKSGNGRIINVASAHGLRASPYKSAYVAAKHGVVGFTKAVALEMAEARLAATCNAICPGYVNTPLVEGQIEDQMKANNMNRQDVIEKIILQRQPTKQFASVGEIGAIAVFLASDAAAQITGTAISVDGGWTAR
jgi:3-hydroxybutyrate dehydrogenase